MKTIVLVILTLLTTVNSAHFLIYPEHDASQVLGNCIFSLQLDAHLIVIAHPLISLVRIRYFVRVIKNFSPSILLDVLADLIVTKEASFASKLETNKFLYDKSNWL